MKNVENGEFTVTAAGLALCAQFDRAAVLWSVAHSSQLTSGTLSQAFDIFDIP